MISHQIPHKTLKNSHSHQKNFQNKTPSYQPTQPNHQFYDNPTQSPNQPRDRASSVGRGRGRIQCQLCGKQGHIIATC